MVILINVLFCPPLLLFLFKMFFFLLESKTQLNDNTTVFIVHAAVTFMQFYSQWKSLHPSWQRFEKSLMGLKWQQEYYHQYQPISVWQLRIIVITNSSPDVELNHILSHNNPFTFLSRESVGICADLRPVGSESQPGPRHLDRHCFVPLTEQIILWLSGYERGDMNGVIYLIRPSQPCKVIPLSTSKCQTTMSY